MSDKPSVLIIGEVNPAADIYTALEELNLMFAANADEVIDITSDNETIDVVFVRADHLGDTAAEICRWLKTDGELKLVPFVVMGSDPQQASQWLSMGAVDYLNADIHSSLLLVRLKLYFELKHKADLLTNIASLDRLTSLPDRHRLDEYLDIEWRRSLREFYPLSIIILDLDGFAAYNELYGVGSGDDALKRIARQLESIVNRAADMVSRYRDDEFVMLLPAVELDSALILAERMVEAVAGLAIVNEQSDTGILTISAGAATIEPSRDKRLQDLQDEAYEVLNRAQQGGGNQVQGISV